MAGTMHYSKAALRPHLGVSRTVRCVPDDRVRWSARRSIVFAVVATVGLWGVILFAGLGIAEAMH